MLISDWSSDVCSSDLEPCLGATAIIEERSWSDAKLLGDVVEEFLRNVLARPQAETRMPEQAQLDGKPEAVHRATVLSDRQLDVVCRKRVVPDQAGLVAGNLEQTAPILIAQ